MSIRVEVFSLELKYLKKTCELIGGMKKLSNGA